MYFYNFNVNDFNASTRHLSHVERALYRDLIDMYYSTEKPITTDLVKLERQLIVKSDDEKQALQNVLADFFVVKKLKGDDEPKYHNSRIDRELKNYKHSKQSTNATTNVLQTPTNENTNDVQTTTDRQNKHREKVNNMVKLLKNKGIKANSRMKIDELQALFDEHCKQDTNVLQTPTNENTNVANDVQTPFDESITKNQEPNNHKPIKNKYQSEIAEVFEFWKSVFEKSEQTILSDKRKSKIIERLKNGYSVEQIKQAIYNCSKSEFHVTGNHTDLELICRNVEKLDYFLGLTEQIRLLQIGANHASNQPTTKKTTTKEYADRLGADVRQYLDQRAERTVSTGNIRDVC